MRFFNFFKKPQKKVKKNFYQFPSLSPTELEREELFNLINNAPLDEYAKSLSYQARSLSIANPLINGYFQTLDSEIYGDNGITLDVSSSNKALNKKIEDAFYLWREKLPRSDLDFWDIESIALIYLKRDGECFLFVSESENGLEVQIIDNHAIAHSINDNDIFKGIKRDKNFQAISYFIYDKDEKIKEIPAKNIIHIYKSFQSNQSRGITALASIIAPANQKDKFKAAELKKARLQSEITGVMVKSGEEDAPSVYNPDSEKEEKEKIIKSNVEVGRLNYVGEDIKLQFTESHNATNMEFFINQTDREIAKSLGMSHSTLTGDLRDVNYSSIRHGGSEQRRHFRKLQNFIIRKLHNKIFEKWLLNELKRGLINSKEYELILKSYTFKPQGWEYIDPLKEMNANAVALETGIKTLSEILRERGKELDTHIEELSKEAEIYEILKKMKGEENKQKEKQEKNQEEE
ncbi:phage portal protein [Helicobacter sp. faydin-H20]|uniref:phage portal protein n=1 Tax=Helicobacter anatolicus TaxID=2905874 RepID=UPI001E35A2CF|nr:phage portal protein [Helicobacter anatolicus]MCE3037502.1 phage portal protein [Helicobacter anatolicus]